MTKEEQAEEWVKDQLGMDYVRGLQSISAKDCHGMIETIMRECFVAGYEVGHSAGYDDGADALADYLEKLK